jgi:hypothetical protein
MTISALLRLCGDGKFVQTTLPVNPEPVLTNACRLGQLSGWAGGEQRVEWVR